MLISGNVEQQYQVETDLRDFSCSDYLISTIHIGKRSIWDELVHSADSQRYLSATDRYNWYVYADVGASFEPHDLASEPVAYVDRNWYQDQFGDCLILATRKEICPQKQDWRQETRCSAVDNLIRTLTHFRYLQSEQFTDRTLSPVDILPPTSVGFFYSSDDVMTACGDLPPRAMLYPYELCPADNITDKRIW